MRRGAPEIPSSVPDAAAAIVGADLQPAPASRPTARQLLAALDHHVA